MMRAHIKETQEARDARASLVRALSADVEDRRVLRAIARVPRHLFVPEAPVRHAYGNYPLSIGYGQTISQPLIVALMTEALELRGTERVLEIGTGSGYQAAVLSTLVASVYSVEVVPELATLARRRLERLGYSNVHVRTSDGYTGWLDEAPFDRILVTAAPVSLPRGLLEQLCEIGILVCPVGPLASIQSLMRYRKRGGVVQPEDLGAVRFVPMISASA